MNIKIIIDLLLLTIIITYTIGISGFIDVLKEKYGGFYINQFHITTGH